jgi:hypothetical protein
MNALKTLTQSQGCSIDGTQTVQNPLSSLVNKVLMPNKIVQKPTEFYKESLMVQKSTLSPFDRVKSQVTVQNPLISLINKMNQNPTEVYKESLRIQKSTLSPFDRVKLEAIQHTYKVRDINQILKDACSKGDIETVRQMISEGAVDFDEGLHKCM